VLGVVQLGGEVVDRHGETFDLGPGRAGVLSSSRSHGGPTLLVQVEPAVGLTRAHIDRVADWLTALPA
jgi:hypothetical protein